MNNIHKLKLIISVLIASIALLTFAVSAYAEEGSPIGNFSSLDIAEGEADESASDTEQERITLSNGVGYDRSAGLFYYSIEDCSFAVNVPDGAIVTEPVSVQLSKSLSGKLYKNGTVLERADLSCITAPGSYVLEVLSGNTVHTARVAFTILSPVTNAVKEYRMPADFYVVSATLNGEQASCSPTRVDMSGDGNYVISYRAPAAERDMLLCVTVDHAPPEAKLAGITDGKANGEVTVSDVEEGAGLFLVKNGKQTAYTDKITETGAYILTVRDKAGNEAVYEFVLVSESGSLMALVIAAAVLTAALVGYITYYRKYIRLGQKPSSENEELPNA